LSLRKPAGSLLEEVNVSDTRVPNTLFFAILVPGMSQCFHDYPLLPNRLASHFSASGNANGWMTKPQFFLTYAVVILPALALEFWVPRRIAGRPDNRLRLPNKEFWLALDRRAETFAYLENFFAWYGCAFLLLEVFAMGLAMRANFQSPPRLPTGPIVFAIVTFALFNVACVTAMFRRFSKPRQG
jgi:uncharacterized membrane protein